MGTEPAIPPGRPALGQTVPPPQPPGPDIPPPMPGPDMPPPQPPGPDTPPTA